MGPFSVERMVVIAQLGGGDSAACRRWLDELRARRDDMARSWSAAGMHSCAAWVEPTNGVIVMRVEAPSLDDALQRLATSDAPFDQWFRECSRQVVGQPLLDPAIGTAELLIEYHPEQVDALDLFMVVAVPIVAGREDHYRRTVTNRQRFEKGLQRVRRWGLSRLDIWMQEIDGSSWAVYDAAGDLSHMLREMSTSADQEMVDQRALVADAFGVDLAVSALPLPSGAWSWSR